MGDAHLASKIPVHFVTYSHPQLAWWSDQSWRKLMLPMEHMTQVEVMLSLFAIACLAGFLGALVGLGGGIIIVPALTLLYDIPIHYAIGAYIVSVIATSSGAAAAYVREHMTNLRAAM